VWGRTTLKEPAITQVLVSKGLAAQLRVIQTNFFHEYSWLAGVLKIECRNVVPALTSNLGQPYYSFIGR